MRKLLCWLFGHDRMVTGSRQRRCLRCGLRERRLMIGDIVAWEDTTPSPARP
jgi:hypothetical protein